MHFDPAQLLMPAVMFAIPALIGAASPNLMKAVATAASCIFVGHLLVATLFSGWNGFGSLESRMLAGAASVPVSVPLAAVGYALRRLWLQFGRNRANA